MFLAHKFTIWAEFGRLAYCDPIKHQQSNWPGRHISKMAHLHGWLVGGGCQLGVHLGLLARGNSLGLVGLPHSMMAEFQEQVFQETQMEAARVLMNQP